MHKKVKKETNTLPGVSFAVILSGYYVFKQLPASDPKRKGKSKMCFAKASYI